MILARGSNARKYFSFRLTYSASKNNIRENSVPSFVNGDKIINSLYPLSFSRDISNFWIELVSIRNIAQFFFPVTILIGLPFFLSGIRLMVVIFVGSFMLVTIIGISTPFSKISFIAIGSKIFIPNIPANLASLYDNWSTSLRSDSTILGSADTTELSFSKSTLVSYFL